jgi:hypothetical protein
MYAAGLWLVMSAVGHGTAHVWSFVLEHGMYGMREFAMNAMKQAPSAEPLRPTLWGQFRALSMGFGLLLLFAGGVDIMLAWTRAPHRTIASFSLFATAFWTAAFGLFAFVEPLLQGILVSMVAVPLHAIAYTTSEYAAREPKAAEP